MYPKYLKFLPLAGLQITVPEDAGAAVALVKEFVDHFCTHIDLLYLQNPVGLQGEMLTREFCPRYLYQFSFYVDFIILSLISVFYHYGMFLLSLIFIMCFLSLLLSSIIISFFIITYSIINFCGFYRLNISMFV